MKLQILPFSFTSGLFAGTPLALLTLVLFLMGTPGTTIGRLGNLLPGFEFSPIGAAVGFGWLFLGGMLVGALVSLLYNLFVHEAVSDGPRPVKRRSPKRERRSKPNRVPKVAKAEKLPEVAKPAKEKKKTTRTPHQTPTPKRHKTPYPGKVGSWKSNSYSYGGYKGWSASA